jgi:16S rRNA (uracil1498-N3)-methyltransferase
MTRRRWIADEYSGDRAALLGEHAAHLSRVLRGRVGQQFDVAAGERLRRSRVISVSDERVEFELGDELPVSPQRPLTVALAIFKFDRFEWAVEKLTELGVARIVPFAAARTDPHLAAAAGKRSERWRRIAREAAEQSRRVSPPEISDPARLVNNSLQIAAGLRIILAESEEEQTLATILSAKSSASSVALALGPEGGWTAAELEQFAAAGWTAASLGDNILRAETAAIAATAIAQALLK